MSLFKTRTFWRTNCKSEPDESFDQSSLTTSKLNTDSDFVIAGSHSGILRIFKPCANNNDELGEYKVSDLIIEKNFGDAILQVATGRLVSGSSQIQLAVLQPRAVGVFCFVTKEGATDHGVQHILQQCYEHKSRRLTYNFTLGPFGGGSSQSRDFLCTQSLDGLLCFYEQETYTFSCFLPDFLVPAPLAFAGKSDSFITGLNWNVASFKYKLLSEVGERDQANADTTRKITSDWTFNLGESILDLAILDDPVNHKENNILVLGERNLFCLSSTSKLKYMKRLDYSPICFHNYVLDDSTFTMVVSETSTLLVYKETTLKWAANLDVLPISLARANVQINGILVFLSQEGELECAYLGTEPNLFIAPPLSNTAIDFDKAGLELATLHKIIKASQSNDNVNVTNANAERELSITVSASPHLEFCPFEASATDKMATITVQITPQAPFEECQVALLAMPPLQSEPRTIFLQNLHDRIALTFNIVAVAKCIVPSLDVQVVVSFVSTLGVPRCVTKEVVVPLSLVAENCVPDKRNDRFKVTLDINHAPVTLSQLFPDFAGINSFTSTSNAIGFRSRLHNGDEAKNAMVTTILLAKSSERYRLQSDSLACLGLFVQQMVHRLRRYYANKGDFRVTFSGSTLPGASDCQKFIDGHFRARQMYNSIQDQLSRLGAQFRLIQRRLIVKFKVKNPTPLCNLELLLTNTLQEIMELSHKLDEETANLSRAQIELSCALNAMATLMPIMDGGHLENNAPVLAAFSPIVYDAEGQNWEDVMDGGLCYLLRTILAKNDKDKLRAPQTSFDEVKDPSKLSKHFTQSLERIPKLLQRALKNQVEEENDNVEKVHYEDEDNGGSVPIGSEIGESSSRLLSARNRGK